MNKTGQKGFSLIELLVVIAIIAILSTIAYMSLGNATVKSRDTKRKADISQVGRMLGAIDCYVPAAGVGDYDLSDLAAELAIKYPQYSKYTSQLPRDPKSGSALASGYRYGVAAGGHCVVYANLENAAEPVTLSGLSAPAPGSGSGTLQAASAGANGTRIYYQVSK